MQKLKSHRSFGGVTEFFQHESQLTKTTMRFSIYSPTVDYKNVKGGLIWLSGLTCTEENFITKAGAQKYLKDHQLALICPDTSPRGLDLPNEHDSYDFGSGASFYVDAAVGEYAKHYQMYSYIQDELYTLFNEMFDLRGNISLFGHSMGGHGALILGLNNPNKFKSISAFSPICYPSQCPWGQKALTNYLGDDQKKWEKYDAYKLIENGAKHPAPLFISQGLDDEFYPQQLNTEMFEKVCEQNQHKLNVCYHKGYDHSYYFIASFVAEHIKFHSEFLHSS